MSSVTLDGVTKAFGPVAAVDNVSLRVKEGEFLVLLGPSGCGKTTSLRLVAGFVMPDRGRVLIGGADVTSLPPRKRNIGMVFQNYSLFPNMTVAENVAFGLRERRVDRASIAGRVGELLELIHLPGIAGRYAHELSGGQQQRVALARALAYTPSVLLMDEPLGALDRKLRESMQTELHRIQRELGITTVFVTHDQEEAMGMADRIVVMSRGRIEQEGTPEELYNRPRTAFVADFLGKTNFLGGSVVACGGAECTVRIGGQVTVSAPAAAPIAVGQRAHFATRPEFMRLARDGADGAADGFPGTVTRRRFLGNVGHYFVRTDWGDDVLVETAGQDTAAEVGERVRVIWDRAYSVVFPAADRPGPNGEAEAAKTPE